MSESNDDTHKKRYEELKGRLADERKAIQKAIFESWQEQWWLLNALEEEKRAVDKEESESEVSE